MVDRDGDRLVAWAAELRRAHSRLREALDVVRDSADGARTSQQLASDLLLHCHGFCAALGGHHRGEDRTLFPAVEAARPDLAPVLRSLERDHSVIAHLLQGLRAAADSGAGPQELERHLEGLAAIMESHFRYEERQLLAVLDGVRVEASVAEALGPL